MRSHRLTTILTILTLLAVALPGRGQTRLNPRNSVITVAGADSPFELRLLADYICDGVADEVQWNAALSRANIASGNAQVDLIRASDPTTPNRTANEGPVVEGMPGSYQLAAPIDLSSYAVYPTIRGYGHQTIIEPPANGHAITANYDRTSLGEGVTIENLLIQGDGSTGYHGIFVTNAQATTIRNVRVHGCALDGVVLSGGTFEVHEDDSDATADWSWAASGSGTGEYYLVYYQSLNSGKGIDHKLTKPSGVNLDGSGATEGTVGSLTAGQWDWADNDTIGYSTIYVRLSDDSKPDPGDVKLLGAVVGNHTITDSQFQWNGRSGVKLRAVHETPVTSCHMEENVQAGLWVDQTANIHVTSCSIEDQGDGTASQLGYKSVLGLDTKLTGVIIENSAEISAVSGSFEQWANVAITGTIDIAPPWTESSGQGSYYFTNLRSNDTLSCTKARRIELAGGNAKLGNITAEYFMAGTVFLTVDGTTSKLTISEADNGDSNDSGAYFSGCHWRGSDPGADGGADANDIYTLEASGDDAQAFTITGGKLHAMSIVMQRAASEAGVRVGVGGGAVFRVSTLDITGLDTVSINGATFAGSGSNVTLTDVPMISFVGNGVIASTVAVENCDGIATINSNTFNVATITVDAASSGVGTFVGNGEQKFGSDSTFTNNGTGTWINANNSAGITGGS